MIHYLQQIKNKNTKADNNSINNKNFFAVLISDFKDHAGIKIIAKVKKCIPDIYW